MRISHDKVEEEVYPFFSWRIRYQKKWLQRLFNKTQRRKHPEIQDKKPCRPRDNGAGVSDEVEIKEARLVL